MSEKVSSDTFGILESIVPFLKVYQFDSKFRFGVNRDGGYVLGELNQTYDCYISAGVSDEESFSRDFINKYNMTVENSYAFDGTVDGYPYNYTEKINFTKKNIGGINNDTLTNLSFLIEKYNNIFLKMDIEGGEYPWLLSLTEDQLRSFRQIVLEFHGITNDGWGTTYTEKLKCFEKLSKTHYIIHAHGNNYAPILNRIPDVIELTFVNKSCFNSIPQLNTTRLPINGLDFQNTLSRNEIDLNFYPFVKTD